MTNDSQLQTDVLEELEWRPGVDAAHIGVTATNGVVTLTGQVAHYAGKSAAETAAKSVYGVKGLANDITVEVPDAHKRTDQDLAEAALSSLSWNYEVPDDKVAVLVKNGWITLTGTLDWQYQKDAAERGVRALMGVTGVSDDIRIKPRAKGVDVKHKIEDSFRRHADLEARRIHVSARTGTVTLFGSVGSCAERDQAVWAAWSAPGVTMVENDITIAP